MTSRTSSGRSGRGRAIVDAGPLYAVADADDEDHPRCRDVLERSDRQLVVPALVVAEVIHIIGRRLGAPAEAQFRRGLAQLDIEAPASEDWPRIAELVERYGDWPLGGTDASVVALAERLDPDLGVTLDRRHVGGVRPRHAAGFRLLPDDHPG